MSMFFRLLGVQLNQRIGLSVLRSGWHESKGRTLGRAVIYLVAIVSIGFVIGMYTWLISAILPAFLELGLGDILLGLVLLAAMVMVFFMGLFYLIGMLFFSKDTEFLASLPIPQSTVFAAKFAQVLLGEVATVAVLLLPPFILYGIRSGVDFFFWIRMVVVTFTAPCIPLAIAGLLSLLLMRFTALWRRRDLITVIGSILLLAVFLLGQSFLSSQMPEDLSQGAILSLIADSSALLRQVVSFFPPSGWAAQGLSSGGGMLWLYLGVSAVSLALLIWIAGKIYYGGAMAQLETASVKRNASFERGHVRRHGDVTAIFLREWRVVLRSPVYALNGLATFIAGPFILLVPRLFQGAATNGELDFLFELLETLVDMRFVLLILAGLFVAIGMINPAVSTSLSREGKQFYISRVIPVSPAKQVLGKFLFGFSVAMITMVFMGVTAALTMGFAPLIVLGAVLLGVVASIAPIALSQLPDILKPKLNWNSETEAIKQNMNVILGMLIGWAYVAALGIGCFFAIRGGMDIGVVIAATAGVSILLGAGALFALSRAARYSWRAIEG